MKLTPGQLRELLGLNQDTYRHWKQALTPLAGKNGYRPCFTWGDLLALAVVKALVEDAGVRVGTLQPIAATLFHVCNASPWAALERSTLVVELVNAHVEVVSEDHTRKFTAITIQIPCRPIIEQLRKKLLTEQSGDVQHELRFPPAAIAAIRRNTGSNIP